VAVNYFSVFVKNILHLHKESVFNSESGINSSVDASEEFFWMPSFFNTFLKGNGNDTHSMGLTVGFFLVKNSGIGPERLLFP